MFHSHADRWLSIGLGSIAGLVALILLLIVGFLGFEALPALAQNGWLKFLGTGGWFPVEGKFEIFPMVLATLLVSLGAVVIAVPMGIGLAIYLQFVSGNTVGRRLLRPMIGLMAGTPSVVYGLWGLTTVVPIVALWQPPGASALSAMLILALMVLPTIALTSESAFAAVPKSLLDGAAALGLSRSATALRVAMPAATAGIVGGILLAITRALGETMAVLMVAGNVPQVPSSFFDPVRVLTANIALEMAYATGLHKASLFVTGLILLLLVAMLVALAHRSSGNRVSEIRYA